MVAPPTLEIHRMNSRSLSILAILGFLLLGGVCLGLRYRALSKISTARDESQWRLTYNVSFEATTDPTTTPSPIPTIVRLAQPFDTRHCAVESRTWSSIHPELKFEERILSVTQTRQTVIRTSQPKTTPYSATATFRLRLSPRADMSRESQLESLSRDARQLFIRSEPDIPANSPQVKASVDALPDDAVTEAERVQAIFDECLNIETPAGESLDSVDEALRLKSGSPLARARAMVAMCRAIRI